MSSPSLAELHALRERLSSPELDQGHLFHDWPSDPQCYTPHQRALLLELYSLGTHYHGGVVQYIHTARRLLSGAGEEDGVMELQMPDLLFHAPSLLHPSAELDALETSGTALLTRTVFVLVAGGLGERLGYSGIKVALPVETATQRTYLEHYLGWARQVGGAGVPFVIMTSDDTHARTTALLAQLALDMPNVRLLKQNTVFCLSDRAAHLALGVDGALLRKPHGHGDAHALLAAATDGVSGVPLVDSWLARGYEYVCFLQDTNAPATLTIPVTLAVSARERLTMNFTCIPRAPREAVGLLCKVRLREHGAHWVTKNVEYNVFESIAPRLTAEGGDVAAAGSAFSPFPGSINTLIYRLEPYAARLRATHGVVPEFINPKYADASRRAFKKPARVESLMQDFAQLFVGDESYRVGGTVLERFTYQPVKNSLEDGVAKVREGMHAYAPFTGEADFYELMRRRLRAIGVVLDYDGDAAEVCVNGAVPVHLFPIVTLDAVAMGAGTLRELRRVFPYPAQVQLSARSTLLLEGHVVIESLTLDGALRVCGPANTQEPPLIIRGEHIQTEPWTVRPTTPLDKNEVDQIRGFVLVKTPPHVIDVAAAKL